MSLKTPRYYLVQGLTLAAVNLGLALGAALAIGRVASIQEDALRSSQDFLARRDAAERLGVQRFELDRLALIGKAGDKVFGRPGSLASKAIPMKNLQLLNSVSRDRLEDAKTPLREVGRLEAQTYWESPGQRIALNATLDGHLDHQALSRAISNHREVQRVLAAARARAAEEVGEDPTVNVARHVRRILDQEVPQ